MNISAPTPDQIQRPASQRFASANYRENNVILGRIGTLETRIATTKEEIGAAQEIRYRVFVEEMGAKLPFDAMLSKRDFDQYDHQCDHLLVIDRAIIGSTVDQIVGTYRLMQQNTAEENNGFYSQNEYDVHGLVSRHPDKRFLELGRSCVLPKYRSRRSIELLWQGIWAYCLQNNIDVMFGCASFHGTVPAAHAQSLSFLYHFARATDEWHIVPQTDKQDLIDLMPAEALKTKEALSDMPPLIKGYLRVGALFSPHAFVDTSFNTTDVLIIMPLSKISSRYINHYGADAERFNA
ncbi:GNAT family N-acetyltransferase [Lentilitoribacter sp. Alg239-R112]|jgi:putative hemolysin|uniref:GNAT family N-acetyltransferase n=1 Tax=Lentilitoribacter sp. Alg239-R112 TaxID=2305987 RepID=UPI0013A6A0DC|nr:GNAT family N-acetyltransferase [Lentilitoribacter sp. Alg239-R112]